jgi:signal transduction histidine kinase
VSRARLTDALVALAFIGASQAELWWYDDGPRGAAAVTIVAAVLFPATLALRSLNPAAMAGTAAFVLLTQSMLGGRLTTTLTIAFASMLIAFSVGLLLPRRRGVAWAAVLLLAAWFDRLVTQSPDFGLLSDFAFTLVIAVGAPFLAGAALRDRRERTEQLECLNRELEDQREQQAQLAAQEERARIAREMHDVVAHSVSLMVVQAGAARQLLDRDPQQSREALLSVESVGRQALGELRRSLGMLRNGDDEAELAPQPGTKRLPELLEQARDVGLDVTLETDGHPVALSPGVDLAVYRIVQEALTNTVKHASASTATVRLSWKPDELDLSVVDDGVGPPSATPSGGHGLVGMSERVMAYGGTLETGAASGGGFAVRARIPLASDREVRG